MSTFGLINNCNYVLKLMLSKNYLFKYFSGLTKLKELQISSSRVTDFGISYLKGMLIFDCDVYTASGKNLASAIGF